PEVTASLPGQLTYSWMFPLILNGYRKGLNEGDVWQLNPRDASSRLVPQFEIYWEKEVNRVLKQYTDPKHPESSSSSSNDSIARLKRKHKLKIPSLFKVLCKIHCIGLMVSFITKFFADISTFISPLILGEIISYMSTRDELPEWRGYILAVGLMLTSIIRAVLFQISLHQAAVIGMQMKSTLTSVIYQKALTMTNEARKIKTSGEIVNLMSVDCQRIQDLLNFLALLWSTPLQIVLSLVLLYYTIGPAVFAGVVVLCLMIPINSVFAGKQQKYQQENLKIKDKRIKWMTEILNGIKVLKLYGWELSFQEKVEKIRALEIRELYKIAYTYIVLSMSWAVAPFLVTFATFATYILMNENNVLDAQKAFVTLSLFNLLRVPLNLLGIIINFSIQAFVSVKRINAFIIQPDLDPENSVQDQSSKFAISVRDGEFKWDEDMPSVLHNINIEIAEGKLVTVVGQVGCGKSSLISAILGEMDKLSGDVRVKGTIAYVPQQAWMKNDTVKGNILFGKPYNENKYTATLETCALTADLAILPGGDMTEIGEKGINLSGGQKQRVSLARALYSDADIYLFDDPLSAVDSHVGKHIFKKMIGPFGCLKGKTRLLVTHGVHWLPMVDNILVMNDGRITERGTYAELIKGNAAFAQFLKTYLIEGVGIESEDEEPDAEKRMWEKIDAITSDGATSGDENPVTERKRYENSILTILETIMRSSVSRKSVTKLTLSTSMTLSMKKEKDEMESKGKLIEVESTGRGKIPFKVFLYYFKAAGSIGFAAAIFFFVLFQAASIGSNYWLTFWTDDPDLNNATFQQTPNFVTRNHDFLTVYGLFGVFQVVLVLVHSLLYWTRLNKAAQVMHSKLMDSIFRAPMSFLDTTPIGRIINRLSRDTETIDSTLPQVMKMWLSTFLIVSATILVISITTPIFIAIFIPIGAFYYFVQEFYIPTSRQLKRIESVTRTPIYTHFSETLSGASTIRAYGVTGSCLHHIKNIVDKNQVYYFAGIASNRWLGLNLDLVSSLIVFSASILAVASSDTGAGPTGLSISYALQISAAVAWMVRQMSDLESNIVSVERVLEYSKIESEAALINFDNRPSSNWPDHGSITWSNYQVRYRQGLDLVLKGVSCDILGGEKIGIVGRTGAGKSSMLLTLFRLVEGSGGEIIIDGVNIADIGLHDLRSRLTILPQDPVLFSGTLRMNLDPFDEFTDDQIWVALGQSHLKPFVEGLPETIFYECGEGGSNFSVGQRQLVCLARTLLRRTRILVLDEATAAVDYETDSLIQKTVRESFKDCTIITIAHRLNTILDYDRIIVMDDGRIVEFDKPNVLLEDRTSVFYGMAREAGITNHH
ncbi:hypothetical protein LOTGIDRAFT_110718, partial [Lottia gigantea]